MLKRKIFVKKNNFTKILFYFIATFLLFVFVAGQGGLIRIITFYQKVKTVKTHIIELDNENAKLEKEISNLNNNGKYIEKIAREELGLVKPGEVVYKFVPTVSKK